jgi:hypothetical protein
VSAPGRTSRLAGLVGAAWTSWAAPVTYSYYGYWRGSAITALHVWLERGHFFGLIPTNDDVALVFIQAPAVGFAAARSAASASTRSSRPCGRRVRTCRPGTRRRAWAASR